MLRELISLDMHLGQEFHWTEASFRSQDHVSGVPKTTFRFNDLLEGLIGPSNAVIEFITVKEHR